MATGRCVGEYFAAVDGGEFIRQPQQWVGFEELYSEHWICGAGCTVVIQLQVRIQG
jgi:hypothetical protein